MKKLLAVLSISFFTLSSSTIKPATVPGMRIFDLHETCGEASPAAVTSIALGWNGSMISYEIKWCSTSFTTENRRIYFMLSYLDKDGKKMEAISTGTGAFLDQSSKLHGTAAGGISLPSEPYQVTLRVNYLDLNQSEITSKSISSDERTEISISDIPKQTPIRTQAALLTLKVKN